MVVTMNKDSKRKVETLGEAAARLLRRLEARRNRPSGEMPERIEPEASSSGRKAPQASGIRANSRGLELEDGQPLSRVSILCGETTKDRGYPSLDDVLGADRNGKKPMLQVFVMRRNAVGARLDEGWFPRRLRPAVLRGANDNRKHIRHGSTLFLERSMISPVK
ncbi:hypothetical protein QV13_12680 [Mesorhizobium hungaricum]|jgi:hypothetical protein|uniref:Uncharacterized protein n=2 Tax=Phyllobacteriaceae TaxID=69277 RepID=A0A1C2DS68_9HYPH|nr:hypothetical protein QV13_12680 [Mesorhizobium hungaricum]